MMMRSFALLALIALLTPACALYEEAPPFQPAEPDGSLNNDLPDVDADLPDMADMPDEAPTCTPKACQPGVCGMQDNGCGEQVDCGSPLSACPADTCGMIPDGCGGMLDCGACKCVGGQPTTSRCGTCELGLLRCEDDTPVCEDIPLPPGVQVPCDSIVYVDSEASGASGLGTRASPFASLRDAIDAAQQASKRLVIIAGEGASAEPIVMADGVHVIAGFAPGSFARNPALRPHHTIPAGAGDVFGVTARAIVQPTVLSGLRITTADATAPSATNYGVYAANSPGLTLHALTVNAGRGGPGRDGAAGMRGADGGRGEEGRSGTDATSDQYNEALSPSPQGRGGVNMSCPAANGGDGGRGALTALDQAGEIIMIPAEKGGSSAAGVMGGTAGRDAQGGRNGQYPGDPSNVAAPAGAGMGGQRGGAVMDSLWAPAGQGETGPQGAHGRGAGGGGGAFFCTPNDLPSSERCTSPNSWSYGGPGGGGGGAGGCGGLGGEGGAPGGGSFGLFALNSAQLFLSDCSITASAGGEGGDGGEGGAPGMGATGGAGSNKSERSYADAMIMDYVVVRDAINRTGGAGGKGSPGLKGGSGGGGAGGVSYGAYCAGSPLRIEGLVTFQAGPAALGGNTAAGVPSGEEGSSQDELQCR